MALTLTIADSTTGNSAIAVIAGSLGAVVNVYTARVNGATGGIATTLSGTRTGDGSVSLSLSKGYFFAYAETAALARTGLRYFAVTDALDAVATRARNAIIATMQLVPIPPTQHIYTQLVPDESNIVYPCVICTIDGVQETDESSLSTVDDWGRPCKVMICDRQDTYDHGKLPNYELWRQKLMRCFVNQQLAGMPESSKICKIEPYVIVDPSLPIFQRMVAGFVVRAVTREERGVGV